MIRQIIKIDEKACNGCGACAAACHEGAIGMVGGKARLLRDDYCDGLGDCLPACPMDAIHFVKREAVAYDERAVQAHLQARPTPFQGCPGSRSRALHSKPDAPSAPACASGLQQWPCQIKLVPVRAPYYQDADLLVAADCTAYAYAGMHDAFMRGRITLIGCPKLDGCNYAEKLTEILRSNAIRSVMVARMEVPCCGGLEMAVRTALQASGRALPLRIVTISVDGIILNQEEIL